MMTLRATQELVIIVAIEPFSKKIVRACSFGELSNLYFFFLTFLLEELSIIHSGLFDIRGL